MPLTLNEIRARAHGFVHRWQDEASERAEAQTFWNELLAVFGVDRRKVASFEKMIARLGRTDGRIDLFWPGLILAEHKSRGEDLDKATVQAFGYLGKMPQQELPQYIIVSDFARFKLFDLTQATPTELEFSLAQLPEMVETLSFLAGYTPRTYKDEDPINIQAAQKLGDLYDALKANGYEEHSLKLFLVRLLFVLFAEDTGIFPKDHFRWCVENKTAEDGSDTGRFIMDVFTVLDEQETRRQKNIDEDLNEFRYINGSLFSENLRSPAFDVASRGKLLELCAIRWNEVSPAIFGSLFQTCLSDKREERRQLGAHYTSEKNILKLINSLFLDKLKAELAQVASTRGTQKKKKLEAFQTKLRGLTFLDPACGCGNFLVIAYRELRLLENQVLAQLLKLEETHVEGTSVRAGEAVAQRTQQVRFDTALRSMVDVDQFYGIEIEELPVQIARVALWLMDHQMNMQLAQGTGLHHLRLPLKAEPHITQGNALRMDWQTLIPRDRLSYILGNPPFIGKNFMDDEQKHDLQTVLAALPKRGQLDYVTCWHVKALDFIQGTGITCAFVSTNSITQGQQVGALWPYLLQHGFDMTFAHRTFKWTNEARGKAAVYVIIIGFGAQPSAQKSIFHYEDLAGEPLEVQAQQISPYLVDTSPIIVDERTRPLCDVPPMINGSKPTEAGHLILTEAEKDAFLSQWPEAQPFIRPLLGADEFINGWQRYCIWLQGVAPNQYRQIRGIMDRVEAVRRFRLASAKAATRRDADRPTVFAEIRQSDGDYIVVPRVSSENRYYMPCGYLNAGVIVTDLLTQLPNATLYHFGVVQSQMHMAWMRQVCGRLEGRYRYSNKIVYNNFPWPASPSVAQTQKVEACAQAVLDARAPYLANGNTLADLYDPNTMPPDLLKAHHALDKAVDACYGRRTFATELERVQYLFGLYQDLTAPLLPTPPATRRRRV